MMHIILFGSPGSGKGTQAQFITKKYGIPQVSTGDMLRSIIESGSKLGRKIKNTMDTGELVSDDIVVTLIKNRLAQKDCDNGFMLDGFPRTISQAKVIKKEGIKIDYILEFHVPDELLIERVIGRRIHIASGRIYHIKYNPPKTEGIDDITGEPLIIRKDDQEDIIRKRLTEYHKITMPVINYYVRQAQTCGIKKYLKIDGTKSVSSIHTILERVLD